MSNQIVISSGAKVRSLEGVLTGSAGIVSSVPLGGANGVATLDSSGKVPLSQLPASVVTYLGTWNAATNTPTLANGTGDVGDLYICNVAGTVNFGAGPITFAVGDWVIYNGSQWQKSAGQNGTVTSVAVTSTGNDAISITGSPITTAGTINIGFTGDNTQYINGAGDLTTFPSLTGFVPYTGATQTLDMGAFDVNARGFKVNGTAGSGHVDFKHQSGTPTGSASSTTMFADTNGNMAWKNDHNYITTLASNANTADRTYTFPDANGTIALTSDISYPVTSVFGRTGAVTAQSGDYTTTQVTEGTNLYFTNARARGAISLTTSGTSGAATYNSTTGVLNVPNYGSALSGYVPYTGATSQVDLGSNNLYGKSLNVWGDGTNGGGLNLKQYTSQSFLPGYGYTAVYTDNSYGFSVWFLNRASTARQITFSASLLGNGTGQIYNLPASNGTIALTSDIPSLANYVTTNTNQSITGIKTFTNEQLFGNGITLTGGYITYTSGSFNLTLNTNILTANRNVFLQDKAGTIALTSDLTGGTVTSVGLSSATSGVTIGSSPITTSGTITLSIATASGSQQGLLSSTDWTTFNNKQNALTNPVTGTGTSTYHAKFTGTSTIGNSMLTDDGTTLQSIGATRSNLYLKAASNSYYSQLAFTNGTNGSFGGLSYNNASQYMQFEVNSSEYMRLYGNGNLRLFSSSATDSGYKLQVEGTGTFSGNVGIGGGANERLTITGPSGLAGMVRWTDATTGSAFLGFTSGGVAYIHSNNNSLAFGANGSNNFAETMRITSGNVGIATSSPDRKLTIGGTTNAYMNFNPTSYRNYVIGSDDVGFILYDNFNSAYRMVVNSSGNLLVGLTGTGPYLDGIVSAYGSGTTPAACFKNDGTSGQFTCSMWNVLTTGNNIFINFLTEGAPTIRGSISYNRGAGITVYNTTSDYRLKTEIEDFNALDIINKLQPKEFRIRDSKNKAIGFIAHELQEYLPQAVSGIKDEIDEKGNPVYQSVDYSQLTALLTKAIQELKAEIDELKNK